MDFDYLYNTFFLAMQGIPVTLKITFVSLIVATPIAFLMAMSKIYNIKVLKQISTVYISFIRAVPSVLLILIVYSFLPSLLNAKFKQWGININVFSLPHIIYAYVVFSLIATGLLAEIFRSALLTVNKGELEAALANGLSTAQAYRRIIIPQALVVAIPNLCNLTIGIIKASSLVFLMSVQDITAVAKIEAAGSYRYIESYIDIFIIYIIICASVQLVFTMLEKSCAKYKSARIKVKQGDCVNA